MSETGKPDLSALRIRKEERDGGTDNGSGRKGLWIALGAVIAIAAAVLGFRSLFTAAPRVETATAVLTFPSQANAVLTASGYVVARQKASVASKGTGRLVYLGVEEGDKVKKGEIIARLEDGDVMAALEKARADLLLARADSLDAGQTLARQRMLFSSGLTSQAELDAANARYHRVLASITSAKASVDAAEVSVENTRIRAPFDGTVLTKDADVGEVVAPFASSANSRGAVVTMADMSSLEVEADVSESNIGRVNPGQPVEITLDSAPDKRYPGIVHKIVPTADRAKATVLTKVRFNRLDDSILPEMSAKVVFLSPNAVRHAPEEPARLTVPTDAIVERDGRKVVFMIDDGVVHTAEITTGGQLGSSTIITAGLARGQRVVVRPDASLTDGAHVATGDN